MDKKKENTTVRILMEALEKNAKEYYAPIRERTKKILQELEQEKSIEEKNNQMDKKSTAKRLMEYTDKYSKEHYEPIIKETNKILEERDKGKPTKE